MENKTVRPKMSVENRAKQFMPFAALKGLPEALEEKERSVINNYVRRGLHVTKDKGKNNT